MTSNQQQQQQQQTAAPVVRTLDPVKKDGVLKEMVKSENEAKEKWKNRWKFVFDYHKYCIEEAAKEGLTEEEFCKLLTTKKPTSELQLHGWKFAPSEKLPTTSSGMVGWRSSRKECSLERFGPLYQSERHTISLPDRPPTPPQQFIFLG